MRHGARRINPRTPALATTLMERPRPSTPHNRDSTTNRDAHSRTLKTPIHYCSPIDAAHTSPHTPPQDFGSVTLPAFRPASANSIQLPSLDQVLEYPPAHLESPLPLPVRSLGSCSVDDRSNLVSGPSGSVTLPAFRPTLPSSTQLPPFGQVFSALDTHPGYSPPLVPLSLGPMETTLSPAATRQVQPLPVSSAVLSPLPPSLASTVMTSDSDMRLPPIRHFHEDYTRRE